MVFPHAWKVTTKQSTYLWNDAYHVVHQYRDFLHKEMHIDYGPRVDGSVQYFTQIKHYIPLDKCRCGNRFDNTPNRTTIRFLDIAWIPLVTPEDVLAAFDIPIKCGRCFYREEYDTGHWVPKFYKLQLGITN